MPTKNFVIAALFLAVAAGCNSKSPSAPDGPAPPAPAPSAPAGTAPAITAQPSAQSISAGQSATLSVSASGDAPLGYQWFVGGSGDTATPAAGATSATFTTPLLTATESYWVRVSNPSGSANSGTATITVIPPPPPPAPAPLDPSAAGFEDSVLTIVNQHRASGAVCGGVAFPPAAPLAMQSQLRSAAHAHSGDMAAYGYFSHTSLDGRTFSQRIRNSGYQASPIAENIGAGYSTPQAVVDGWMASAGHCSNIMSGSFRSIGAGYAYQAGSPYGYYWTLDFGGS